jgi:hypothetical protein
VRWYRRGFTAAGLLVLLYQLAFLLGRSPFLSPLAHAAGVLSHRMTQQDMEAPRTLTPRPGSGPVRRALLGAVAALGGSSRWIVIGAILAFNFTDLYRATAASRQEAGAALADLPVPAPPRHGADAPEGKPEEEEVDADADADKSDDSAPVDEPADGPPRFPLPRDRSRCPVCTLPLANPAATSSGFLCCYACLSGHVQRHAACPVTGVAMNVSQIRRVFVN